MAVIVAVLEVEPGLAVTFALNEPFPVRLVGAKVFIVSQFALLVIFQVLFEVTPIVAKLAAFVRFHALVDNERVAGAGD